MWGEWTGSVTGGKVTNLASSKAVCSGNRRMLLLWQYFRVGVTPSETVERTGWRKNRRTDEWMVVLWRNPIVLPLTQWPHANEVRSKLRATMVKENPLLLRSCEINERGLGRERWQGSPSSTREVRRLQLLLITAILLQGWLENQRHNRDV